MVQYGINNTLPPQRIGRFDNIYQYCQELIKVILTDIVKKIISERISNLFVSSLEIRDGTIALPAKPLELYRA